MHTCLNDTSVCQRSAVSPLVELFTVEILSSGMPASGTTWGLGSNAILSCLLYSACSIGMTLVNKAVTSSFGFRFNSTLLLIQGGMTTALLLGSSMLGFVKLEPLTISRVKQWLPINCLFILMLFTSFKA